jgi:ketosteroid isomerase-like protein
MSNEIESHTRRIIEELFRCGKNGDIDGVFALLDENVVVHEPPFLPYGGTYRGRDAFLQLFALIQEKYFDDDKFVIDAIALTGSRAVVLGRAPGKQGEEVMLAEEMCVRDGKVVEVRIYMHSAPLAR